MATIYEILDIKINYQTIPTTVNIGVRKTYDDGGKITDDIKGTVAIVTTADNLKAGIVTALNTKMGVTTTIVVPS